jgi:hypothetical protein
MNTFIPIPTDEFKGLGCRLANPCMIERAS